MFMLVILWLINLFDSYWGFAGGVGFCCLVVVCDFVVCLRYLSAACCVLLVLGWFCFTVVLGLLLRCLLWRLAFIWFVAGWCVTFVICGFWWVFVL